MKILLADDEENIKILVEMIVTKKGYSFCYVDNGEDALTACGQEQPDLMILDVMMPRLNGFEVCKQLRDAGSKIPIIILSAKGDIVDKSIGFTSGADDYLVKPFSSQELLLRIDALLRRHEREKERESEAPAQPDSQTQPDNIYSIGDIEINFKWHEIKVRGRQVEFTAREFKLLSYMATHPGEVFSKEQLQKYIWGENYAGELAGITVMVRKIREKIEIKASKPEYILTVWGIGYKFAHK